ncbi:MAG TPA: DUF6527 family protein [Tepidisphaeraceae bacterium]|nr:DUF6527 family protein [Tepidisphaeraceae bacterium]
MKFSYRDVIYEHVVRVPDQTTASQHLQPGVLVLVMPGQRPKSLKFLCPCGCGKPVSVNLMPEAGKAWRLAADAGGLSLFPSVWLDVGCRSHFILRRNKARLLFGTMPKMTPSELERWWS